MINAYKNNRGSIHLQDAIKYLKKASNALYLAADESYDLRDSFSVNYFNSQSRSLETTARSLALRYSVKPEEENFEA